VLRQGRDIAYHTSPGGAPKEQQNLIERLLRKIL